MVEAVIPKSTQLEDLVPPLELCKQIPAGEFTDTAFQWQEVTLKDGSKGADLIQHYPHEWHQPEWARLYPAPTLQEIMAESPDCKLKHKGNIFFFEQRKKSDAYAGGYNAAELALQVWLKMKGIKNEQQKNARVE